MWDVALGLNVGNSELNSVASTLRMLT